MRSFIKVMGPPLGKAINALEKIAIDIPQVCIMDEAIIHGIPIGLARDIGEPVKYTELVESFFIQRTGVTVSYERCSKIISKSGTELGEFDFYFEWLKKPTLDELQNLIERIDDGLAPLGVRYTITTK